MSVPVAELAAKHAALRDTCPVPFAEVPGMADFWSLMRYNDVTKAARDTATFINNATRFPQRRVPLESDPPEHTKIRRLLQPYFMPDVIANLEPLTRQYALELILPMLSAGECDAVATLTRPLPAQVLLNFIGMPASDWQQIKAHSEQSYLQHSSDAADQAKFHEANVQLWEYSRMVVRTRQQHLRDIKSDAISGMLCGMIDDAPIDPDLVVGTVRLLLAAGHDSTTSSLAICLHYLARTPQDQTTLREHPEMIPTAIEEMLRYESPVIMMPRTVAVDTQMHGCPMKSGDRMMLNWASANRDPAKFENADECKIDRTPNRHVVFGHGIHTCIGSPLARQEIRVALEELLTRSKSFVLAGEVKYQLWHRFAPAVLPLKITPAIHK